MYVSRLEMRNWQPFRGEHVLDLEPKAYAIVASLKGQEGRSNGLGKSSIVEAIRFALFGEHRHRSEDGWITRGEAGGYVSVVLSDGSIIKRTGTKGKRARVAFIPAGTHPAQAAVQADAQSLIVRAVGMTAIDFEATCYFEQKRMNRLIVAKPDERMTIIAGWLNLDRLQDAEDRARAYLQAALTAYNSNAQELVRLKAQRVELLGDVNDLDALKVERETAIELAKGYREQFGVARAELDGCKRIVAIKEEAAQYEKVVRQGLELKQQLATIAVDDEATRKARHDYLAEFKAHQHRLSEKAASLKLVAGGNFDGACPVVRGFECPARVEINRSRSQAAAECREVEVLRETNRKERQALEARMMADQDARADRLRIERTMSELRGRAKELQKAVTESKRFEGDIEEHYRRSSVEAARLEALVQEKAVEIARLTDRIDAIEALALKIEVLEEQCAEAARVVATHREALVIFGRNGAQRRLAEKALSAIEKGANDELIASGVDLRIGVQWSREGKDVAKSCGECGFVFAGKTAKTCGQCGAERGLNQIQRLDIELSDRSGGLEDLAGIYLQLAASAWLRSARGCAWESAVLDEPWSAADGAYRRALARSIGPMLSNFGYRQSFVVTHSIEGRDLQGRIEIERDGADSRVSVR